MATQKQIQTRHASNEKVTIQDLRLRPWHTTKLVHVKVLRSWVQNIQLSGEIMEFIFMRIEKSIFAFKFVGGVEYPELIRNRVV
ncbi:unnamed protein product [Brassica rapa subsp. trilocularis]|uniref:Uncharacterized protein n=1 Tax=Brassica campestris TaxID=3711 RepID=M4DE07_BRACM